MADMLKSFRFVDVLPYQSISIFNTTFLPRRVRVSKVHLDSKTLANQLMTRKLRSVVCRNRLDVFLEWAEQMYYSTCQFLGVLSIWQLSHK